MKNVIREIFLYKMGLLRKFIKNSGNNEIRLEYFIKFWRRKTKKKKKTFSTYFHMVLLTFLEGGLIVFVIKFQIQGLPTLHTFDEPRCTKNGKYMKKT